MNVGQVFANYLRDSYMKTLSNCLRDGYTKTLASLVASSSLFVQLTTDFNQTRFRTCFAIFLRDRLVQNLSKRNDIIDNTMALNMQLVPGVVNYRNVKSVC